MENSIEPTNETVDTETSNTEVENTNNEANGREAVFEMTDEDFDKHLEVIGSEDADTEDSEKDGKDNEEVDLNELYREQLDSSYELDKPILLKVDGTVLDIKDSKDLRDLAEKGLKFTQKTQQLAKYRDVIGMLEDNDLLDRDRLMSIISGETAPVDVVEPRPDTRQAEQVEGLANEILQSEYADDFKTVVGSLNNDTKSEIASNADLMNGLYVDVQSGFAQSIMPQVVRYMNINGLNFLDAYMKAGSEVENKRGAEKQSKQKLNAEPRQRGKQQKTQLTREDIFDMSDSDFDKYLEKLN